MLKYIPDQTAARLFSTNSTASLLRANVLNEVSNKITEALDLFDVPNHRFNKKWVDPLNPTFKRLRRLKKKDMQAVTYDGKPITTVAFQAYGTTSLWWVLMYVNGHVHPHEIPRGSVLYIPAMADLAPIIETTTPSRRGTIVRA